MTEWSPQDVEGYKSTFRNWRRAWGLYDETLATLFANHPGHRRMGAVVAKVGLVQRAYEAGLERQVVRGDENSILIAARTMVGQSVAIDRALRGLRRVASDPAIYGPSQIHYAVSVHATLLGILRDVTRERHSVRSFVSKYLHFHCPGVPLYDSRASRMLQETGTRRGEAWYPWNSVKRRDDVRHLRCPQGADPTYWRHCASFLAMWNDAVASGLRPTVRGLDVYLIASLEA